MLRKKLRNIRLATPFVFVAALSCASSPAKPTSTAAPVTAPAAAPPPAAGAPAGVPGAGGRGPALTPEQNAARRDSLARLRAETVKELMATIAGKENLPAGQVFKNVQLMKDVPAGQFLIAMDSTFGRGLSRNCVSCHVPTDYADDSKQGKVRGRIMIAMVNAINKEHLTKLPAGRGGATPTVTCITCHRGIGGNPGRALMP